MSCGRPESRLSTLRPPPIATGGYFYWDEGGRALWVGDLERDLLRTTETGETIYSHPPFGDAWDTAALNPTDGSLNFVNGKTATLLRLAPDGTEHLVSLHYNPLPALASIATVLAIDPHDGSFWVSLRDGRPTASGGVTPGLFHLAADGTGLGEIAATGAWRPRG